MSKAVDENYFAPESIEVIQNQFIKESCRSCDAGQLDNRNGMLSFFCGCDDTGTARLCEKINPNPVCVPKITLKCAYCNGTGKQDHFDCSNCHGNGYRVMSGWSVESVLKCSEYRLKKQKSENPDFAQWTDFRCWCGRKMLAEKILGELMFVCPHCDGKFTQELLEIADDYWFDDFNFLIDVMWRCEDLPLIIDFPEQPLLRNIRRLLHHGMVPPTLADIIEEALTRWDRIGDKEYGLGDECYQRAIDRTEVPD